MRVAYLVSQYPAPSHTFIRREVDALRRHGIDVQTFSVRRPKPEERQSEVDAREYEQTWYVLPAGPGIVVAHLGALVRHPIRYLGTLREAIRHRVPGLRALIWSLFYFAEAIALASELHRRGIHHVHNHFANAGGNVGYLATRYLAIDWSLTLHGISEFDYPSGLLLPDKIRAAQWVACVSHFGRAQAMRSVEPEHWDKLFIARCGVELSSMPKRPQKIEGSRLRIVTVGRLSPEKGQSGLLRAFRKVVDTGADAELRLVGDGPGERALRAQVKELGLDDRVHLAGRLPEQGALEEIAAADVFVLSSFMEGLPVVLMEALALGVPVVAPTVAGIPELVEAGESGLLFSPGDWHGLAVRLERLLIDPSLRDRLAAEGGRRVEAAFDIERAIEPLLARYR